MTFISARRTCPYCNNGFTPHESNEGKSCDGCRKYLLVDEQKERGLIDLPMPDEIEIGLFYAPAPMSEYYFAIITKDTKAAPITKRTYAVKKQPT